MPDRRGLVLVLLVAAALAACTPEAASSPAEMSLWGPVHILGEAEQTQAPALWVEPDGLATSAWVGSDQRGVHHDARVLSANLLGESITLPLPPVRPFGQRLLPAEPDALHLLWLDLNAENQQRLFAARIASGLLVERGPTLISNQETYRYAAAPLTNGRVQVIWSGGRLYEPALYAQQISERGLADEPTLLARDADWPAMIRANDSTLHLFWLQADNNTLHYGILDMRAITQVQVIPQAIALEPGDRLHGLYAALDFTHLYLFWHVTRRSGDNQTWMVTRPIESGVWSEPQQVGLGDASERALLQAGFNTGRVFAVGEGENWLRWGVPMAGQFDILPVAGRLEDNLAVIYFQAGVIAGYQRLTVVRTLIGPPILLPDRDRYLYIAWAEPSDSGQAQLKLTKSRG